VLEISSGILVVHKRLQTVASAEKARKQIYRRGRTISPATTKASHVSTEECEERIATVAIGKTQILGVI
jgi:hypothetical protein